MPPISVTIFASDAGKYFLEDDGSPGNNFSRIRFPDGTTVAFEHPTDDLFFDPSVAGVSLTINLADSLGTSRFSTGSFSDPLQTADSIGVRKLVTTAAVTMVANLTIRESGADAAADITASSLMMRAGTGVGTAGKSLETQVGVLEAQTDTGGINIRNVGTVAIGGLGDEVQGLAVMTSGNIFFENFGSIVLSDESGPQSVKGGSTSGNVTLIANGVDCDLLANVDQDSISAPRGNITLTAGRDMAFGLIGSNFDNDVRANGTITFNTGRDFLLDGFADVASDNFAQGTGGDVIVNAGRNVTLLAVAGTDAGIEASGNAGGDVILNTGPGGTVTLNSGNGTAPFASLISQSGDVIANTDRISIGTNGAISTLLGQVMLRPISDGWTIDLGSATDAAFSLELSDAELDRIFTPSLVLGGPNAGTVTVSSSISPLNAVDLAIRSGTDVVVNAGVGVQSSGNLVLRAGDDILLIAGASLVASGSITGLVDVGNTDPGTGARAFVDAGFAATLKFIGEADGDTLFGGLANDTLDGAGGADTLRGRAGNDTYDVDNDGDTVIESFGEGTDTVRASLGYTLTADVEKLVLTGSANIAGTGNELDNELSGNSGNNGLNGGVGADTMAGGDGDDTYTLDNVADSVVEGANKGTDLVRSPFSFSLAGKNLENLTLTGGGDTDATGNGFDNVLTGNAGNNVLNGGNGVDTMIGLGGNDSYVVANVGDTVVEAIGGGTDLVQSSVSFNLSGQSIENLTLTGGANIDGTGNPLANTLVGNAGDNLLNGGAGSDTLSGAAGADTFNFKQALGAGNIDSITDFNVAADTIRLDHAIFDTIVGVGVLIPSQFVANATGTAEDATDRILYDTNSGQLYYDSDGNADGGRVQFAQLSAGLALTAADFVVA